MNNHYMNSCGCENSDNRTMDKPSYKMEKSLAMAYVPWQKWQNVMDGCNGLKHGSIFEDLILPFEGTRAACASCNRNSCKDGSYNNAYYRRGMK